MRQEEIEKQERIRRRSFKIRAETDITTTSSVTKKANAFSASDNKACSNGGSRVNECGNSEGTKAGNGNVF